MNLNLNKIGTVIGVLGILVCLASVLGRFVGDAVFIDFQAINVFIIGVGLLVLGCFAKLSGR